MSCLVVRPAQLEDAGRMAKIAGANPTAPQWTAAQFRELLAPGSPDRPMLRTGMVAQCDGDLCGFAVASALVAVFPVEAELESLAVEPAQQGRGIGLALLHEVVGWAVSLAAGKLRLEVRAGNERALRIYGKSGFREIGTRPAYYANPIEDAIVMERTF